MLASKNQLLHLPEFSLRARGQDGLVRKRRMRVKLHRQVLEYYSDLFRIADLELRNHLGGRRTQGTLEIAVPGDGDGRGLRPLGCSAKWQRQLNFAICLFWRRGRRRGRGRNWPF